MEANKTSLERAFELARSGKVPSLQILQKRLASEGYTKSQIEGRVLKKQLNAIIEKAAK